MLGSGYTNRTKMGLSILIGYYILAIVVQTLWLAFSDEDYMRVGRGSIVFGMIVQALIIAFLFHLN